MPHFFLFFISFYVYFYLLYICTRVGIAAIHEPAFSSVFSRNRLRMDSSVQFRMSPFVFLLCHWVETNSAWVWCITACVAWVWCKTDKVSCFIISDVGFHFFNLSSTYCTMCCPGLVTFTFGMFFPVFCFSTVSAYADPQVVVGCHGPMPHCMPCNERACTWFWIC